MRKFLVPEVVQTSALDCGPAALKSLLAGFGVSVSYERLREACQTGLDGTSIDTIEVVAQRLGLEAEQVIVPLDHILLSEAGALPAIVVVQLPNRATHFVVVWRRHGPWLQVMDPGIGRRWMRCGEFLHEIYRHRMPVAAADWREFAGSDRFVPVLRARLLAAHLGDADCHRLCEAALRDEGWQSLAALDASTRLLTKLQTAGVLKSHNAARRMLEQFCADPDEIPEQYWSVRACPPDEESGVERLSVTGAVLLRALGSRSPEVSEDHSPDLSHIRAGTPIRPGLQLLKLLAAAGSLPIALMLLSALVAAAAVPLEALLFRSVFDVASVLRLPGQRLFGMVAMLGASALLLLLDVILFRGYIRLGRHIDLRFRLAFLQKIPRLSEQYFQSRLISDLAERSHSIHRLRNLPDLVRQLLMATGKMLAIGAGLIWLQPDSWLTVALLIGAAVLPYALSHSLLQERDLRVRTHIGGLTRFYLDGMLGLSAMWAHGAARSYRREQSRRLQQWQEAAAGLHRTVTTLEAVQLTAMFGLVAYLLLRHPLQSSDVGRMLLVLYWATSLPSLGQDVAALARQYPSYRNQALRLFEPLGAAEEERTGPSLQQDSGPPAITFRGVSALASGHVILHDIDLEIAPGEHIAVVGPSGAGKSSLASLLLGFCRHCDGEILCNGKPLDVHELRSATAWVDPTVQLWNRTLFHNIQYGSEADGSVVAAAVDHALLRGVLETLPEGLQTNLGEGGGRLSGGEGERVRLARASVRGGVRLVILDEPFRGLDRAKREELMIRARRLWSDCTLICITHDIAETLAFDRVIVMERGTIAEAGSPHELRADKDSRYAGLLAAEAHSRGYLWSSKRWRRIRVEGGAVFEADQAWSTSEEADALEVA